MSFIADVWYLSSFGCLGLLQVRGRTSPCYSTLVRSVTLKLLKKCQAKIYNKILNKMYNRVKSNTYIFLLIQKAFEMTKKEEKKKRSLKDWISSPHLVNSFFWSQLTLSDLFPSSLILKALYSHTSHIGFRYTFIFR